MADQTPVQLAKKVFDAYAGDDCFPGLQARLHRWEVGQFGLQGLERAVLGVQEETGELAHAVLKHLQGIRGMDDREAFREKAGDAIADIVIYCIQVCTHLRLDFQTLLDATAAKVMERQWKTQSTPTAKQFRCDSCGSTSLAGSMADATRGAKWKFCRAPGGLHSWREVVVKPVFAWHCTICNIFAWAPTAKEAQQHAVKTLLNCRPTYDRNGAPVYTHNWVTDGETMP